MVVDAHVAAASPEIADAAVVAGVPFIIDPQTYYWQDYQHPADAWAQLPYARPRLCTPADLLRSGKSDALVAGAIEHQLAYGATTVVAPYVHIERADDGWTRVQASLWHATRRYVERQGLRLPLVAVLALSWRSLDRSRWPETLDPLYRELVSLNPHEVALAASTVDTGAKPDERLTSMIAVIQRISRTYPVIAWQQGTLGEAAVAGGAIGYECGIGWRERCDLRTAMAQHRSLRSPGGAGRPVYIHRLRRSIPKASVRALLANPAIAANLVCLDHACCPNGRRDLAEDARAHAIGSRLRGIEQLSGPAQPAWRWHHLAQTARVGIDLAERINTFGSRTGSIAQVDQSALRATLTLADNQTLRRRRVA